MHTYFSSNLERFTRYQRYQSRVVNIGHIPMGGHHPIRIQSMTNTNTMDTTATVQQTIRLADAGCDYVRITAPSVKEARNLGVIKEELKKAGYRVPLIADIHFVPRAAEIAARLVEKVRVNPGNYVDRKNFQQLDYSKYEYEAELEQIARRFKPLVQLCREEGTAMRIGSNHGSLSDRILSHYGDTPLGMVESALEFVRICAAENFHDLVISMKASNTRVMIQAYRLLIEHMERENFNYPLHLGVTEAGDGDDARLKSALGIGSLLKDGLGDTIRVSLTEAPEAEVPVAIALVDSLSPLRSAKPITPLTTLSFNPFEYHKRKSRTLGSLGGQHPPRVMADLSQISLDAAAWQSVGYHLSGKRWQRGDQGADILYLGNQLPDYPENMAAMLVVSSPTWLAAEQPENIYPLFTLDDLRQSDHRHPQINFVSIRADQLLTDLPDEPGIVWLVSSRNAHRLADLRRLLLHLVELENAQPVILSADYASLPREDLLLNAASELGSLLTDGLGDGIFLQSETVALSDLTGIAFGILQASRSRMTKTEYIACPSCGRTLFDLEEVTASIRSRTGHLKGLKIGIMGCIVNGPGEMADADFGYVGTGPGKVSLYRGQNVVQPHVPQDKAVDALIDLIKAEGFWIDP